MPTDSLTLALLAGAGAALVVLLWALGHARQLRRQLRDLREDHTALQLDRARSDEQARAAHAREQELRNQQRRDAERAEAEQAELKAERNALRAALDAERRSRAERDTRIEQLNTTLEKEREAAEERLALLSSVREDMQAKFRELAQESVRTQGEALGKAHQEKLEAMLKPLRENVGKFETELRAAHQGAATERARLKTEIETLTRKSEAISQEAVNLTRALKGDTRQQGAWGEMILTTLLERSGLREGEEYVTQSHATDEEGRRFRPDVVVYLPGGKSLVVDSKVSLRAYERAVNAETEEDRAAALREHVTAMRAHIDALSRKGYQRVTDETVDYVVMFLPIEGALSEALRTQGDLTSYALDRHVTIATPTTLMMALRTIENVWAVERRTRNAEEIADRAGKLYDKVASFVDALQEVGKRLDQAGRAHSEAVKRLQSGPGNVIRQVEQLRELGAKTSKTIALESRDPEAAEALDPPEAEPPQDEDSAR